LVIQLKERIIMAMFSHMTIGTNNLEKARDFYDRVLATLGYKRVFNVEGKAHGWGTQGPEFIVLKPANGEPATVGNGLTIGFAAPSRAAVQEFHKTALSLGAKDEGAPGPRALSPTAYAAYVRDMDGNKICTYCFKAE
jgi:catechol 2,3-dioxygenase-like lactoylglutathione lyase family enzyme